MKSLRNCERHLGAPQHAFEALHQVVMADEAKIARLLKANAVLGALRGGARRCDGSCARKCARKCARRCARRCARGCECGLRKVSHRWPPSPSPEDAEELTGNFPRANMLD